MKTSYILLTIGLVASGLLACSSDVPLEDDPVAQQAAPLEGSCEKSCSISCGGQSCSAGTSNPNRCAYCECKDGVPYCGTSLKASFDLAAPEEMLLY